MEHDLRKVIARRIRKAGSLRSLAIVAFASLLFVPLHGVAPLYISNQYTYLAHGLAQGGFGSLEHDWFTGTTDPYPLFSRMVETVYAYAQPALFYAAFIALALVYLWSLVGITSAYIPMGRGQHVPFLALLLVAHAGFLSRTVSRVLFSGLGEQYILGHYLQPSAFGVFLLASLWALLRDRPVLGVALAAIAPTIHPSYAPTAALIVFAYALIIGARDGRWRQAAGSLGLGALLIAPTVAFSLWRFAPTSGAARAEADRILVEVRMGDHTLPSEWFGLEAAIALLIITAALYRIRSSPFLWLLVLPGVVSGALTLVQVFTGNHQLALAFPWRTSVLLAPVASSILLASLATWAISKARRLDALLRRPWKYPVLGLLTVALAAGGGVSQYRQLTEHPDGASDGVAAFLEREVDAPEVVLVPPYLREFRLKSGLPIVGDWKSHPYKDDEVIEWYGRYQKLSHLYYSLDVPCRDVQAVVERYAVRYIVWPAADSLLMTCSGVTQRYADGSFSAFEVTGPLA